MAKSTFEVIAGKRVKIPSAREFAAFFDNYSPPDRKNPWIRNLLGAIYDGGIIGMSFNDVHRALVARGTKWSGRAPAMKVNQLAKMIVRRMSISIGPKRSPFYSPILLDFDYDWKTNGHVYLKAEVARSLEMAGWVKGRAKRGFSKKRIKKDTVDPTDPDSFLADEGNLREVLVRRVERSRAARNACIKIHAPVCAACGLCFGDKYGIEFENLIEVHHLHPLGFSTKRKTNVEKDLRPICPNCHAMAHWNRHKQSPRSIVELRRIIQK